MSSETRTKPPDVERPGERRSAPSALAPYIAVAPVALGSFMAAMDSSIVSSILPTITRALESDVASIEWVVTAYLLVQSGLLLSFGRLGDLRGHKAVFVWGFAFFTVGSVLCGMAPGTLFLVASRAIQAIGAAIIFANSPAILTRTFPPDQRGRILGMQATVLYLGLALGPPLGGWLASLLSWRAVFYINIPVCLMALALSLRFIPSDAPSGRHETFDVPGAGTYVLGLVLLMLGLNQGHVWGWTSPLLIGCIAVALCLLGLFVAIERRVPSPMLQLGLFEQRAFTAPVLSAVMNYMGVTAISFLVPFYLIQGRGLDTAQTGLMLTAQPIVMAITASFSGALSDRIGSRLPATVGMAVFSLGLFLLSRAGQAPLPYIYGSLAVSGLGIGLFTSPNNSAVMGAVPARRRGVASGVLATARTLGNSLGIGMAGAIFASLLPEGGLANSDAIIHAVSVGLLAASAVALIGAFTSATRPAPQQL
jgi:EmrB/QacA subfamily drug resistance transporter